MEYNIKHVAPHYPTTNFKSLSNKSAKKTISTSVRMRPSIASAIRAYVDRANMASEEMVLMRLK